MTNNDILKRFTNLYQLSKTLRFELIPQGNFKLDDFIKSQSFENDLKRAEAYPLVKKIIDSYHIWFIDNALKNLRIDWQPIKNAITDYRKDKNEETKKVLVSLQKNKRKEIYDAFKNNAAFKCLFKEDLISDLLPIWIENSDDMDKEKKKIAVKTFNRFSTYFSGFHKNRENIYSAEAISTSVPYRIVHDNFPKFLGNLEAFEIIKNECKSVLEDTATELQSIMDGILIKDIFSLDFFNHVLTQNGIDFYNRIISGVTTEKGQKLRGINEFMNLYRQQHPEFAKNKKTTKMVILFKQILSDRETLSFIPEMFVNDKQVQDSIKIFYTQNIENFNTGENEINICDKLCHLISQVLEYDTNKLYIQQPEITNISQKLFGKWNELTTFLYSYAESKFGSAEKTSNKKKIDSWLKSTEFSFLELNAAIQKAGIEQRIENYFDDIETLVQTIKNNYESAKPILNKEYGSDLHLREQAEDVEKLKLFLDALQELMHRLKPLCVLEETDRDLAFYNEFDLLYNQLKLIVPLYNKVRNYVTQKLGKENKIKLNFENPTLAKGWDENKEVANTCVLFLKDSKYFLGIMNAKNKPKFTNISTTNDEPCYQKMVYKYFKDITTMIPKCSTQLKAVKEHFSKKTEDFILYDAKTFSKELCIKKTIFDLNNTLYDGNKKFQKDYLRSTSDDEGYKKAVFDWISFCMDFLKSYKSTEMYDYSGLCTLEKYDSVDQFYSDVNKICYTISFVNIPVSQINNWVNQGKLFLFQIYNKDFATGATGRPNLHTLYWKNLFAPENLKDVVLKLNGEAEFFYRDSNIKKIFSHKMGEKMVNRRDINGESIPDKIYKELFLFYNKRNNIQLSSEAKTYLDKAIVKNVTHEIIKDRRYTQPKFLFHVPMTINFKADTKNEYINERVRMFLANNPNINIIGLDRGERHLIYLSMINQKGEIIKQKSFNTISDTDYQKKLVQREKERDEARKSWGTIGKIKELKEGYLSQVIHEIATMMVDYNAIVVLEDLNYGFKRGRFKVERQVYQKFEKMLIDKLNYLVFKEKASDEAGGILKGYQLTEKFRSFKDIGKQCGFLFYVPAAFTSKIDPTTGFVNLLNLNYTNVKDAQTLISKMDKICYNSANNYFEFAFNYDNFKTMQTDFRKQWVVCTVGEKRFAYVTNEIGKKETKVINVTQGLKELFDKKNIEYANSNDIKKEIVQQTDAKFFERLLWLFKLTMQLRNSNADTNEDFILSPVKNDNGEFFMSNNDINGTLPADADANGAYHIAMKGLYLMEKVLNTESKHLKIEHKEWFEFAQNNRQ